VLRLMLYRLLGGIATLLAVSVIVFTATELLPGDVAAAVLGRDATPESLALIRSTLNLSDPAPVRYANWLWHLVQGDPGISLSASSYTLESGDKPITVSTLIGNRLPNSFVLAAATTLLLIPLSIVLGLLSAVKRGRSTDRVVSTVTLVLISLPEFVTATFLVLVFAVLWGLVPAVSFVPPDTSVLSVPKVLVLPVLALLAATLAQTVRMVRASATEILRADYVHAARLRGLTEARVLRLYVLPNALGPVIQVFAINVAWLVGGIVVVETVFQYPGLGLGLVDAVNRRDVPTIQAIVMIIAATYVVVNLAADTLTLLLNPKLRGKL
jgi:peptide/nickel transport system permease protein